MMMNYNKYMIQMKLWTKVNCIPRVEILVLFLLRGAITTEIVS